MLLLLLLLVLLLMLLLVVRKLNDPSLLFLYMECPPPQLQLPLLLLALGGRDLSMPSAGRDQRPTPHCHD